MALIHPGNKFSSPIHISKASIIATDDDIKVVFPDGQELSFQDLIKTLKSLEDKVAELETAYMEEKILGKSESSDTI